MFRAAWTGSATSGWLARAIGGLLARDPIDAERDAQLLADLFTDRARQLVAQWEQDGIGDEGKAGGQ